MSEFVDQDVERLLTGRTPQDPRVSSLAPWIEALRSEGALTPSRESSDQIAARVARIVRESLAEGGTARGPESIARPGRRPSWRPARAAFAFGGMALLAITIAFGAVAHQSKPGDALYGVDLALERVGIGSGHAGERVGEADALLNQGDQVMALKVLGETLEEATSEDDVDGERRTRQLLATATTVPPGADNDIRTTVEQLSRFIEENGGAGVGLDGDAYQRALEDLAGP